MAVYGSIRVSTLTLGNLHNVKRKVAADTQTEVTLGDMVDILLTLADKHYSEIVRIARERQQS